MKQNIFKHFFEFDGKRFVIHAIRRARSRADSIAEGLRKKGFNARVMPISTISGKDIPPYGVYKYPYKNPIK